MASSDKIEEWMVEAGCTRIKPSGQNIIGTCPFHADSSPSFSMNSETGQFTCFSESCGEQGGLITFLMKALGWGYKQAKRAADRYGAFVETRGWDLELPDWNHRRSQTDTKVHQTEERLLGIFDFCPVYMRRRGFKKSTLRRWEIGFDQESHHVTIPVRDSKGTLVGISRRKTDDDTVGAKYLHLGFEKSHYLYGGQWTSSGDTVFVGEGQFDALAIHQMGLPSGTKAVSTMGARVSETQIRLLSKFTSGVVLAFDNDLDGYRATVKIGDGLAALGRRNVWVVRYPPGVKDPAQLIEEGRDPKKFLESYVDFDRWRLEEAV